jgi:hypothetical protein
MGNLFCSFQRNLLKDKFICSQRAKFCMEKCKIIWTHVLYKHGSGTKNTNSLISRVPRTGDSQGKWLERKV